MHKEIGKKCEEAKEKWINDKCRNMKFYHGSMEQTMYTRLLKRPKSSNLVCFQALPQTPAVSWRISDQSGRLQPCMPMGDGALPLNLTLGDCYLLLHNNKSGLINTKYIKHVFILKLKISWVKRYIFFISQL